MGRDNLKHAQRVGKFKFALEAQHHPTALMRTYIVARAIIPVREQQVLLIDGFQMIGELGIHVGKKLSQEHCGVR